MEKKANYLGNYPNNRNFDPNIPIGINKWDYEWDAEWVAIDTEEDEHPCHEDKQTDIQETNDADNG